MLREVTKWATKRHLLDMSIGPLLHEVEFSTAVQLHGGPIYLNARLRRPEKYTDAVCKQKWKEYHESAVMDLTMNSRPLVTTVDLEVPEKERLPALPPMFEERQDSVEVVKSGDDYYVRVVVGVEEELQVPVQPVTPGVVGFEFSSFSEAQQVLVVSKCLAGLVGPQGKVALFGVEADEHFRREAVPWFGEYSFKVKSEGLDPANLGLASAREGKFYFNCGTRVHTGVSGCLPISDFCFLTESRSPTQTKVLWGSDYRLLVTVRDGAGGQRTMYGGPPHGMGIAALKGMYGTSTAPEKTDWGVAGFVKDAHLPAWRHVSVSWDHQFYQVTIGGEYEEPFACETVSLGQRSVQTVWRDTQRDLGIMPCPLQGYMLLPNLVTSNGMIDEDEARLVRTGVSQYVSPGITPAFSANSKGDIAVIGEIVERVCGVGARFSVYREKTWFGGRPPDWYQKLSGQAQPYVVE